MNGRVVETDKLSFDLLNDLFQDKICILLIRGYASREVCKNLNVFFVTYGKDEYTHEIRTNSQTELLYYGVDRYGYPLNSTYTDNSKEKLSYYFKQAPNTMRLIREAAYPYISPIDKLRVEFDEVWPYGSNIGVIDEKKTLCGIGRIMSAQLSHLSEEQPHFDSVPQHYFPGICKQFSANIYLNVPDHGGELEIWDVKPIDIDISNNLIVPKDWRAVLPQSIKVKPEQGDLIIFNTRRPHAITKFEQAEPRTSIQTFIGLNKNLQIFLWD